MERKEEIESFCCSTLSQRPWLDQGIFEGQKRQKQNKDKDKDNEKGKGKDTDYIAIIVHLNSNYFQTFERYYHDQTKSILNQVEFILNQIDQI